MEAPFEIPEFTLEDDSNPLDQEDQMAQEDYVREPVRKLSLFKRHSKDEYLGEKERVPSRTIFKKKNLSKQRKPKVGLGQNHLPVLSLHRSESVEKRQMKTS